MVVPYPAGQPTDAIMRVVAGVTGSIGTYTVSTGEWGSHVASGAIYPLQLDLLKDLKPQSVSVAAVLMPEIILK
jgi:hypothetical protein